MNRAVYLAVFAIHFLIVVRGACLELMDTVARGVTTLPESFVFAARQIAAQTEALTCFLHEPLLVYSHLTGIDTGYGFFAPNVPDSVRVVFTVQHSDGRLEAKLPEVQSHSDGLRLAGLLDRVAWTEGGGLRQATLGMLALPVRQENPDATVIRATLERVTVPPPYEFARGKAANYSFVAGYEFRFRPVGREQTPRGK